jgi:TonB family protein
MGLPVGPLNAQAPAAQPADGNSSLRITRTVLPIYPYRLRQQGITEGDVAVVFAVDAEGRLEDIMPLRYTDEEFYAATVLAMKQWTFQPALNQGRPHPVVQFVSFHYEAGNDVVQMSATEAGVAFLNSLRGSRDRYRVVKMAELDAIPTPVEIVTPGYPTSFIGSGIKGEVTIEFYIDEKGRVRMPAIVDYSHLEFASAAVEAVSRWSFEPPKRGGRSVAVMAKQRFHFKPSMEKD